MKRTTRNNDNFLCFMVAAALVTVFVLISSLVCMGLDWLIDKSGCPILYPIVVVVGYILVIYIVGKAIKYCLENLI